MEEDDDDVGKKPGRKPKPFDLEKALHQRQDEFNRLLDTKTWIRGTVDVRA